MRQIALRVLSGFAGVTALWVLLFADRPRLGPKVAGLLGALAAAAVIYALSGSRQTLSGLFGMQNHPDKKRSTDHDG
jgi:hypothetical protein